MKKIFPLIVLLLGFCVFGAAPASAELLGTFKAWSAFVETESGAKVCYMASLPEKSVGKYTKRGDVNFMVTHRPSEDSKNVTSLDAGYAYRKGKDVTVIISGREFKMFTDGGFAWAYDDKGDQALVRAMRGGAKMVARGVSSRGTLTTDTFSLSGVTAAHNAINKACGIK